jgi:Zn-finger nucleic acid-binding protein
MHCPKCGEGLEQKNETNGGIHRCAGCAGLFITLNALTKLLANLSLAAGHEDERAEDLVEYLKMHGRKIKSNRTCPVCAEAMVRKAYPAMQHTALDFCWACQSAWFDRGELNKVAGLDPNVPLSRGGGKKKGLRTMKNLSKLQRDRRCISGDPHGLHELASFLSSYEAAKSRARRKRKDKK